MSLEFEKSPLDKSADFRIRLNALPVQIVFDVVSCTVLSDTVHTLHGTVHAWISRFARLSSMPPLSWKKCMCELLLH